MEEKTVNRTNSNSYTFIFAAVMVIVVGVVLAFTATSLQPIQNENVRKEKMQNILTTVGIDSVDQDGSRVPLTRDLAPQYFKEYITESITLRADGSVDETVDAFKIDLSKELRKPADEQFFPLYIADIQGEKYYIIPLRGKGLWDAIWGYVSLKDDINTIEGAVFDHKGETPGLGGEITQDWFRHRFDDEKVYDANGNFVGISIVKGTAGESKDDSKIDAISGATITSEGVSDMISERLRHYLPYLEKQTDVNLANR
ncbi:MAG: Na(+)-translocating NADH-quinone reductase subunit C [Salinimicrobium sp.]